jgi:hypothetical protein
MQKYQQVKSTLQFYNILLYVVYSTMMRMQLPDSAYVVLFLCSLILLVYTVYVVWFYVSNRNLLENVPKTLLQFMFALISNLLLATLILDLVI